MHLWMNILLYSYARKIKSGNGSLTTFMKCYGIMVDLNVAHGRSMPGMIGSHITLLQSTPDILEAVEFECTYDSGKKFPRIVVSESEAIAFTGTRIIFLY